MKNSKPWNAELYKKKHSFVFEYGSSIIQLLDPKKDERILDLGCGTGELTHQIHQSSKYTLGIDNSSEMIRSAKSSFPEVNFQVASATEIPGTNTFDAVFSNATLHWVLEYEKAIHSIYNCLKSGGRFVAEFGGKGNVELIITQLRKNLEKLKYHKQARLVNWYFPALGEYTSTLEKQNFKVTYARHYDRPTELADSNSGLRNWIKMFAKNFFHEVKEEDEKEILEAMEHSLKPTLFRNGKWYADYKRLQVVAYK